MSLVNRVVQYGISNSLLPGGFPLDSGDVVIDVVCGVKATRGFSMFLLNPWGRYGIKYSAFNKCPIQGEVLKALMNVLRESSVLFLAEAWGGWPCPGRAVTLMHYIANEEMTLLPWHEVLAMPDSVGKHYVVARLRGQGCGGFLIAIDRAGGGGKEFHEELRRVNSVIPRQP